MKSRFVITCALAGILLIPGVTYAEESIPDLFSESYVQESRGEYDRALNSVLRIIRMDTGRYEAVLRAGWLFYLRKDYGPSDDYYRKAADLRPGAIEPLLGRMLPLMALKKWSDAESVANAAVRRDANNYLANSRLAYILFSQGRYARAADRYEKVLVLYPGDSDMKLGLSWSLYRMGQMKRASDIFGEILLVNKANTSALEGANLTGRR